MANEKWRAYKRMDLSRRKMREERTMDTGTVSSQDKLTPATVSNMTCWKYFHVHCTNIFADVGVANLTFNVLAQ